MRASITHACILGPSPDRYKVAALNVYEQRYGSDMDEDDLEKIPASVGQPTRGPSVGQQREEQLERIEIKLDQLLERSSGIGGDGYGALALGGDGGSVYSVVTIVPQELLEWLREANPELAEDFDPNWDFDQKRDWLEKVHHWLIGSTPDVPANVVANLIAGQLQ